MKYITKDRLYVVQKAVRRSTGNCAELETSTDAESFLDEDKYPLKFNVHFASSGDMDNNEVRSFACQLVTLSMVADELTKMAFQKKNDEDPELIFDEDFEKAGNMLQSAIENNEGGKVIEYIKAGLYEKEA